MAGLACGLASPGCRSARVPWPGISGRSPCSRAPLVLQVISESFLQFLTVSPRGAKNFGGAGGKGGGMVSKDNGGISGSCVACAACPIVSEGRILDCILSYSCAPSLAQAPTLGDLPRMCGLLAD